MPSRLSPFRPLGAADGIHVAQRADLRCSAVALKDGSLCLFSPVSGLNDDVVASLAGIGDVAFLLAPNHYHHQASREYDTAFLNAALCAPRRAIRRLANVTTGLSFQGIHKLAALLPDDTDFIEPAGLKTGEIWIRKRGDGPTLWIVVDAFRGPKAAGPGTWSDAPELLKTFPTYGIADRRIYVDWLRNQIERDKPEILVPCHGGLIRAPDLPDRLTALADGL